MKIEPVTTASARYQVYVDEVQKNQPFTIFLHGPGFNSYGERMVLGRELKGKLNFLWFDLLGGAESPALAPDKITWQNQVDDVVSIIRHFSSEPANVIGHCLGAHITHDLVRDNPGLVRKAVWYSAAAGAVVVFKNVFKRAVAEGRLVLSDLNEEERQGLEHFQNLAESQFGENETRVVMAIVPKIRNFDEMYWTDPEAMAQFLKFSGERPFSLEAFYRLQTQFFERGPSTIPTYEGVPVLMLHADDDHVTNWNSNGAEILKKIKTAESCLIKGGSHWLQFQKPRECAKLTLDFFSK